MRGLRGNSKGRAYRRGPFRFDHLLLSSSAARRGRAFVPLIKFSGENPQSNKTAQQSCRGAATRARNASPAFCAVLASRDAVKRVEALTLERVAAFRQLFSSCLVQWHDEIKVLCPASVERCNVLGDTTGDVFAGVEGVFTIIRVEKQRNTAAG